MKINCQEIMWLSNVQVIVYVERITSATNLCSWKKVPQIKIL